MGWKENEFGLLVPDSPHSYGGPPVGLRRLRKLLGEKYLFAKPRRRITPGAQKPPSAAGLDLGTLEVHIEGRGEESLRVLIGVALLRSLDRIPREGEIDFKGADYQRGKGTRFYDAAHRFPCTPKIKAWSVPHYAGSKRLERALERPLEQTDYLPKPVNYADRLFEVNGACEAVVEAVRFVMHEQPVGKPVHIKMIRHAWEFKLWKDFDQAYNDAWQEAAANEEGIDLLDESALERLDAIRSSPGSINFRRPRANMQLVQDALWYSALMARRHSEPAMVRSENITTYEQRLLKLSKEN